MGEPKNIHIIGGGTSAHIANHLALTAPAYGKTARQLSVICRDHEDNKLITPGGPGDSLTYWSNKLTVNLHLTKMAGNAAFDNAYSQHGHDFQEIHGLYEKGLETNEDIARLVDAMVADPKTKMIFFNCALVDFEPDFVAIDRRNRRHHFVQPEDHIRKTEFGKHSRRLKTKDTDQIHITAKPSEKILKRIRATRKDIFLVAFKTTCGATEQEQYLAGLDLLKKNSCNLVLANDTKTRTNMIITPEEAAYCVTTDRSLVLRELVSMALRRSHLSFTQSTVVEGTPISWDDPRVPDSLRRVVNWCIQRGAYKPFNGATVGHFAVKLSDTEFLTSIRRSNFNDLPKVGLVYVRTDGPDTVLAYGAKPSVGGQSQRIIFRDHPGLDCVVHFHCPLKPNHVNDIPLRSQWAVECGSHQCGQNTSEGLADFGGFKAVMLEQHGPNIVFPADIDPQRIIGFIEANFDLAAKTGGYQLPQEVKL
jgi:hypothetical protein